MKRIIFTSVLLLMGVIGEASAICNTGVRVQNLAGASGLLKGNTVCDGATSNWKAQEQHRDNSGGVRNLWDYKHGAADISDPTAPIGTWSVNNDGEANAMVAYGYYINTNNPGDGITPYTYSVWNMGAGNYDFCSTDTTRITAVTVLSGQVGCDSSASPIVLPTLRAPTLRSKKL